MNILYDVEKISKIVNGKIFCKNKSLINKTIENLLYDSRLVSIPDSTLFFALKSQRNDGHRYISDAYNKGVRAFVVNNDFFIAETFGDSVFIKVDDTLKALQKLTAHHRQQFDIPTIGITGSNGKTIVKEWLYQLLSPSFPIVRSPKSYNSQIGVPMSVWQMKDSHKIAIFEAGISQPNEMQSLQEIIRPTIGIFTNIGQAHGRFFNGNKQKIAEKLKLFKDVEVLVYCVDNEEIREQVVELGIKSFTWSRQDKTANLYISDVAVNDDVTKISGEYEGARKEIEIPFTDLASIENAIHCWSIALLLNIPDSDIKERMARLSSVAMRMELKSGMNNCMIINDSYNFDYNALTIALDFMNQQRHKGRKTVILSDILQSELDENELYLKVAHLIKNKGVDTVVGIGEAISSHKDFFEIEKYFYKSTRDFLENHPIGSFNNEIVLLKGARSFGFEHISLLLQEKAHETVLEVNLDNLVSNMNYYRSKLKKETKLMVMVKAFAYGSGNCEVSNVLEFHHADYLAVAFADEGVKLREAGITLPIMVMSPERNTFGGIIKYNLEPEIYSLRSLEMLENAIKEYGGKLEQPIKIHLKLDTGMHRLGFQINEIDELIDKLKNTENIKVQSVFSHLACSDDPTQDEFTKHQLEVFEQGSGKIAKAFPYKILRHVLNTAGITRFAQYQYDMVRLGIGIYGVPSCDDDRGKLHNVSSLKTTITQIKRIPAGDSIGYNRHGHADKEMTIGIVPVGYADGLSRKLGNGAATFRVNGKQAPTIGDICMDMCMLDLDGVEAAEGDTVVIFDEENTVGNIAKICGTIPYEILTSVSQRVKRVYFQE